MEMKDTLYSCSNPEEQQMQQIQDKAKKSCMVSFQLLHSHLKLLSNNDLKRTRTEDGFKRAFATLFRQDFNIFTGTMFLNVDQLEKQFDKEEFQEIGNSIAAIRIKEGKVDTSKALDANTDDVDIKPIYDEEPMAKVQLTAENNVFATGQQHSKQPEFNNEGEVDQNVEQRHDKRPLSAKLTDNNTTELLNQSLDSENICLKKTVAQFQKDFLRMEHIVLLLNLNIKIKL
ncbi:hypothetical protein Tco_1076181 [Tanacetum coccineum]